MPPGAAARTLGPLGPPGPAPEVWPSAGAAEPDRAWRELPRIPAWVYRGARLNLAAAGGGAGIEAAASCSERRVWPGAGRAGPRSLRRHGVEWHWRARLASRAAPCAWGRRAGPGVGRQTVEAVCFSSSTAVKRIGINAMRASGQGWQCRPLVPAPALGSAESLLNSGSQEPGNGNVRERFGSLHSENWPERPHF